MRKNSAIPTVPHSWAIEDWPEDIFPGGPTKARFVIRSNEDELIALGALVRVGRRLVVIGAPYSSWLSGHAKRVKDFPVLAPNKKKSASAKDFIHQPKGG